MSKMFEYKGTVAHQNEFGRKISEFMNMCDFPGEWGVVEHNISFKSSAEKSVAEFEAIIKEGYEKAGAKVFEVTLWRRQVYAPQPPAEGGQDHE